MIMIMIDTIIMIMIRLAGVPTYLRKKNRTDSLQHSSDYDSGDNEDDNDKDRYDNNND